MSAVIEKIEIYEKNKTTWTHLDALESEAIHILREVAAECNNPALLFSGGKDSAVVLHLALKAFFPETLPLTLLHIDTEHNYQEVLDFRDRVVKRNNLKLVVRSVGESIRQGRVRLRYEGEPRNKYQTITLLDAIREHNFDVCIGGARRDEEKARAKERIFSFRDEFGQWDPKNQRPEIWNIYNTRVADGENIRTFPISNWTELDVWEYIQREEIELPEIYFTHQRDVVIKNNLLVPVTSLTPAKEGDEISRMSVRFRTVGDITCTAPVASTAATIEAILLETAQTQVTERGATRLDDQTSEAAMELRKKEGYF
ncbi:MAG: sulfate adenylyltransferase subunit CysD [Burkholderiales bacterium]|jgi:sulfate adenylyltransferase subunit 2|tara:strand:- start:3 stop:944 length:942 start_codon:yes stop_codon:yes gene_type:complete